MKALFGALTLAALGAAALVATPAQANLMVSCTSATNAAWCSGFGGSQSGNGLYTYTGTAGPYTATEIVSGVDILPNPYVLEVHNFEINVTGPGQLSVFVSENGLTGNGNGGFLMNFGSATIIGLTGVSREFWLDYGTANQTLLYTCSGPNGVTCQNEHSASVNLTGAYTVTEEFDMTAGRNCTGTHACELSTDDNFALVPEPATLGLLGTGLVALGAFRRRRKASKSA